MEDINITYKELAPLLKTGDVVLFHGDSDFQKVIDVLTGSIYNHMAMVVLSKDIGLKEKTSPILLWESTPYLTVDDVTILKPKAGPTLVDLEKRIKDEIKRGTFTTFVFRRLSKKVDEQSVKGLEEAIKIAFPDKFPTDWWFFIKGIIGRLFNREIKQPTYFCSELIAYTYQEMGLLDTMHPPDYYEPKDFSIKGTINLRDSQTLGENLNLELN